MGLLMGAGALGAPLAQPLAASSSTAIANPTCLGGKGGTGASSGGPGLEVML